MNRHFSKRRHTDGKRTHERMLSTTNHQENANQKYNEVSRHTLEWSLSKKIRNNKCWEDVDKRDLSCTVAGDVCWCSHYGKCYGSSPKIKNRALK